MSNHQAADEQPQASEISWIEGLSKPVTATPTDTLQQDTDGRVDSLDGQLDGSDGQLDGSERGGRPKWRRPVLVVAAAALCLLTVGGGTLTAKQKNVSLVVDGQTRQVPPWKKRTSPLA